jgi:hypothetical protein
MQRLIASFGVMLLGSLVAFAQTTPEPLLVGYAVVTPSFPLTSGLIVQERIANTLAQETIETSVALSPNLMTNAVLPVEVSNTSLINVGLAIVNPNSAQVTVTMALRRSDGTAFSQTSITIATRRQISELLTELFPTPPQGGFTGTVPVPAEFTGTLVLTSTAPISILALRLRGQTHSALSVTDLAPLNNPVPAISTGVGGQGAVVASQVVTGQGWATEIEVINTTASSLTVRLDVFTPDGTPLSVTLNGVTASSFPNLVVPANGLLRIKR